MESYTDLSPRPVVDMPEVRALCEQLVPGEVPYVLSNEAPAWALLGECVLNVQETIRRRGGGCRYGWRLWETYRGLLIEAEFHAVWVDDDGELHDITPTPLGGYAVFLPDDAIRYEGRQIDNVRSALTDDPLVPEFIGAAEAQFEVLNRGELASQSEVKLTPEMRQVANRLATLEDRMWDLVMHRAAGDE